MLKKVPELTLLGTFLLIGLILFAATNPARVPPIILMAGFFILFGVFYTALRLLARYVNLKERVNPVQYNSFLIGFSALPVVLLALQSIGQLTLRDTLTILIIFAAGYFYVSRQQG